MKTILTGLRVNSQLHLGHYLGVVKKLVALSNRYSKSGFEINLFVPDLHSIVTPVEENLRQNTINNIKYFLAAGLELNDHVHIYRQSRVSAHAELAWVLSCIATTGELSRMTQYKDKSAGKTSTGVGLFTYPILMAADILLYDAEYVPVGEDQFQHLELTRTLADRFNHKYGETFALPLEPKRQVEFMNLAAGVRIRDLMNPEKKMSKSTPAENSKIMLGDDPKKAAKKIMSATTDSFGKIDFDFSTRPGISNLLTIESLLKNKPLETTLKTWQGKTSYGDLKKSVAAEVENFLENLQQKTADISDDAVLALFPEGEAYANKIASQKLQEVYQKIGLR